MVECDASKFGLGATLAMRTKGGAKITKVLQFASRSLKPHEKNYSQTELEGLALVWALSLFRPYLLGRHVVVITDCLGLKAIFGGNHDKRTLGRMSRWALRLQEFTYTVEHRPGLQHVHVDLLSRQPHPQTEGPLTEPLYAIALGVAIDPQYLRVVKAALTIKGHPLSGPVQDTSLTLVSLAEVELQDGPHVEGSDFTAQLDTLHQDKIMEELLLNPPDLFRQHYGKDKLAQNVLRKGLGSAPTQAPAFYCSEGGLIRYSGATPGSNKIPIYVPGTLRYAVLTLFHGVPLTGHLGFAKAYSLLRPRFYWPEMARELRRWIGACHCCQRRKPPRNQRHGRSGLMDRLPRPFATLHFDLVGPFEETDRGAVYILTVMCPFTMWPFAIPIPSKDAEEVARGLKTVFSIVGQPELLVSDRAKEFTGKVVTALGQLFHIQHIKTSGYQPQANQIERFRRFLNAALTVYCHKFCLDWDDALDPILFAYRASVSTTTGYSPFFLTYGREATLPCDALMGLEPEGLPMPQYVHRLQQTMVNIYKGVVKTQLRQRQLNQAYRDGREHRLHVE